MKACANPRLKIGVMRFMCTLVTVVLIQAVATLPAGLSRAVARLGRLIGWATPADGQAGTHTAGSGIGAVLGAGNLPSSRLRPLPALQRPRPRASF